MKKSKSKLKGQSANKKQKKELELTLSAQIKGLIAQFGKVKKSDKAIERFSKKIVKKLSIEPKAEVNPVELETAPQVDAITKAVKSTSVKKTKAEVETN